MPITVQTRPRSPKNKTTLYVQTDPDHPEVYTLTTDPALATHFEKHQIALKWLAAHPELLPGILYVKWGVPT